VLNWAIYDINQGNRIIAQQFVRKERLTVPQFYMQPLGLYLKMGAELDSVYFNSTHSALTAFQEIHNVSAVINALLALVFHDVLPFSLSELDAEAATNYDS